jgi:quinol monooxygenase YgiN
MIIVSGVVPIRPEMREAAVQAALEMARATAAEQGCLVYRFYADLEDPCLWRIYEEWETAEALAAHFETPHMALFRQQLPALVAGAGEIWRYEVSAVGRI